MKGVVLAGGTGSRLFPLTKITNKHLLPIYDKPMIYYPIQTLVDAGIKDILVVTGGKNAGDFLRLLANGKQFGLTHILPIPMRPLPKPIFLWRCATQHREKSCVWLRATLSAR